MRTISKSSARFLVASALALLSGAASADELLVMPYYCSVAGGEPVLSPSLDQGYRVLGPREQRTFTACSPVNPDRCRRWTVYRFDIDCGGIRVPWMSVAAAADRLRGPRTRRAWIENGHFYLPMPASWTMRPDDPCRRWSDFDERWRARRFSSFCAERYETLGPSAVEMPAGFAPMLATDAIFVPAPRGSEPPPPPASAYLGTPPPRSTRSEPSRPAPPASQENAAREHAANAPPPRQEPAQPPAPKELPKNPPAKQQTAKLEAPPAPAAKASETTAPASSSPSPQPPAAAAAPVIPRIINRSEPEPAEAAPAQNRAEQAVPATQPPSQPSPAPQATSAVPPPPAEVPPSAPSAPPAADAAREHSAIADGTISVSLVAGGPSPTAFVMLGLAALATLLLSAFAVVRWRERAARIAPRERDIASVTLDGGGHQKGTPTFAQGGGQVALRPEPSVPQPSPRQDAPVVSVWSDAMPRTRAEAFAVLGMVVRPEANAAAIKKIVDGLRLSWHPDQATDPEDRALRELRIKQINAAWELITGRRPEV